jgi:hypothetical protein
MFFNPVRLLWTHLDFRLATLGDLQFQPDMDSPLASHKHVWPSRLYGILYAAGAQAHLNGWSP